MDYHEKLQLRERDVIPTKDVLRQVLGNSYIAYETFQDALPNLEMEQDWKWYTPHMAWYAKGQYFWTTSRGTKKEKVLYWLHVYEGYFCIAVWFKEVNRAEVLMADVSEETKKLIYEAETKMGMPTFPVVFNVTTTELFSDIYTLIDCKKRIECK